MKKYSAITVWVVAALLGASVGLATPALTPTTPYRGTQTPANSIDPAIILPQTVSQAEFGTLDGMTVCTADQAVIGGAQNHCGVPTRTAISTALAAGGTAISSTVDTATTRIDAPSIGTSSGNQHALPSGTGAVLTTDSTATVTNKSIDAGQLTGSILDARLSANVALLGSSQTFTARKIYPAAGANSVQIPAILPASGGTNGHVIPNVADDTFALIAAAQTLGNKTIAVTNSYSVDVQTFNATANWSKPSGSWYKWLRIICIGQGGGGGSGARQSTTAAGGGGGSGGAVCDQTVVFPSSSSISVTVANSGGTGGTAIGTNTTNGNAGSSGSSASFGSFCFAGGGGGGGGGTTASGTAGSGGNTGQYFGGPGGAGSTTTGSTPINSAGAAGGGGGGGGYNGTVGGNGGNGGGGVSNFGGGVGGTAPSGNGTAGVNGTDIQAVKGGGGGAGSAGVAAAGTGGNGGNYGSGGGGGGGTNNGVNSGSGGNGGPGICVGYSF